MRLLDVMEDARLVSEVGAASGLIGTPGTEENRSDTGGGEEKKGNTAFGHRHQWDGPRVG